jgi:hypothetical protein
LGLSLLVTGDPGLLLQTRQPLNLPDRFRLALAQVFERLGPRFLLVFEHTQLVTKVLAVRPVLPQRVRGGTGEYVGELLSPHDLVGIGHAQEAGDRGRSLDVQADRQLTDLVASESHPGVDAGHSGLHLRDRVLGEGHLLRRLSQLFGSLVGPPLRRFEIALGRGEGGDGGDGEEDERGDGNDGAFERDQTTT